MYCPGHAGVKGNEQVDRMATLTNGLHLGRCEVLRILRLYCGHKASHIMPPIMWRIELWKEEALDDLSLKGQERAIIIIGQTLELFQRQCWGNF